MTDSPPTQPVEPYCSFCNRRKDDVRSLIAGPFVFICDECVAMCINILEDQFGSDWNRYKKDSTSGNQQA